MPKKEESDNEGTRKRANETHHNVRAIKSPPPTSSTKANTSNTTVTTTATTTRKKRNRDRKRNVKFAEPLAEQRLYDRGLSPNTEVETKFVESKPGANPLDDLQPPLSLVAHLDLAANKLSARTPGKSVPDDNKETISLKSLKSMRSIKSISPTSPQGPAKKRIA